MTLMHAKQVGMAWEYEKQIVVSVGSLDNRVSKKSYQKITQNSTT